MKAKGVYTCPQCRKGVSGRKLQRRNFALEGVLADRKADESARVEQEQARRHGDGQGDCRPMMEKIGLTQYEEYVLKFSDIKLIKAISAGGPVHQGTYTKPGGGIQQVGLHGRMHE